ncbi:hypothetical protein GSI_13918 [Ganoderma sinense ZZ0214-1]|uniref:Uncharacterized protein n=1 Tax=Ganoderma sinense ZZ0214-1 TaxID=1077348 RepID=A0A2G8RRL5_9APHY|nr:hypothetical protein GSI_13918 [Ganoderma sinense ZZ0214-1]
MDPEHRALAHHLPIQVSHRALFQHQASHDVVPMSRELARPTHEEPNVFSPKAQLEPPDRRPHPGGHLIHDLVPFRRQVTCRRRREQHLHLLYRHQGRLRVRAVVRRQVHRPQQVPDPRRLPCTYVLRGQRNKATRPEQPARVLRAPPEPPGDELCVCLGFGHGRGRVGVHGKHDRDEVVAACPRAVLAREDDEHVLGRGVVCVRGHDWELCPQSVGG